MRAAGEAEQAYALAEAQRIDNQHRHWDLQEQRAERQREAARRDRQIQREEKAAARARRAASRRAAVRMVGAGLPGVAGAVACVAPTLIATRGQYQFALTTMQLGPMAVLVPMMLEGAAWTLAWRRHQAVHRDEPTERLTAGVWTLALTAAAMNLWHGAAEHSVQVGVAYAIASLVGFGLVELLAGHQRGARAAETKVRRRAWLLELLRALRYPRLSWAAWSRRIELGPGPDPAADAVAAWRQAWVDRFDVAPGADARMRRHGRRRVKQDRSAPTLAAGPAGPASVGRELRSPALPKSRRPGLRDSGTGLAQTRAGRTGSAGASDEELLVELRAMTVRAGSRPSRNEITRVFCVGKERATRLLRRLEDPAGNHDPATAPAAADPA